MAAAVVLTEHEQVAHAGRAHLSERDLERPAVGVRRRVASGRARHAAIRGASYVPRKLSIPWAKERGRATARRGCVEKQGLRARAGGSLRHSLPFSSFE